MLRTRPEPEGSLTLKGEGHSDPGTRSVRGRKTLEVSLVSRAIR